MPDKPTYKGNDGQPALRAEMPELDLSPSHEIALPKLVDETHPIKLKDIEKLSMLAEAISRDCANTNEILGQLDITQDKSQFAQSAQSLRDDINLLVTQTRKLSAPEALAKDWKEIKDIVADTKVIDKGIEDLLNHPSLTSQDTDYARSMTDTIADDCKDISAELSSLSMSSCFDPSVQDKIANLEARLKSPTADESKSETLLKIITTKTNGQVTDGLGNDVDRLLDHLSAEGTEAKDAQAEWSRSVSTLVRLANDFRQAGKLTAEETILRKLVDRKELAEAERLREFSSLIANLKLQGKADQADQVFNQALETVLEKERPAVRQFDALSTEIENKIKAGKPDETSNELKEANALYQKYGNHLGIPLLNETFQRLHRCIEALPAKNAKSQTLLDAANLYGTMYGTTTPMTKEITNKHDSRTVTYSFTWYYGNYLPFVDKCAESMAKKGDWQAAAKFYDLEFAGKLGDCLVTPADGSEGQTGMIFQKQGDLLLAYDPSMTNLSFPKLMHNQADAHLKAGDIQGAEQIAEKAVEILERMKYSCYNDEKTAECAASTRDALELLQEIYGRQGKTEAVQRLVKRAAKEERIRLKAERKRYN